MEARQEAQPQGDDGAEGLCGADDERSPRRGAHRSGVRFLPLPLAGSRRAKLALRSDRIVRCDPGGGNSLQTTSLTRGGTPTPTLPRKRERERTKRAAAWSPTSAP